MYKLERTQRMKVLTLILALICIALSFFCFLRNGGIFSLDFNCPWYVPLFFVFLGAGILLLILFFALGAVQKDLAEQLEFLDEKASRP